MPPKSLPRQAEPDDLDFENFKSSAAEVMRMSDMMWALFAHLRETDNLQAAFSQGLAASEIKAARQKDCCFLSESFRWAWSLGLAVGHRLRGQEFENTALRLDCLRAEAQLVEPFGLAKLCIRELIERDAKHRAGWSIRDATPDMACQHAIREILELGLAIRHEADEEAQYELADVLGCLLHLVIMRGWDLREIEKKIRTKLLDRFTCPPEGVVDG